MVAGFFRQTPRAFYSIFLFSLLSPNHAFAQAMDYGALQELFNEPVTTSATGTPLRASEAPVNMTIITADEIRQSGSRSIPEILARVPGLDILQTGINVYDVGVRGYQQPFQPRLLVLVDGRQVFIDDYSRTLWDNIPVNVDDIRQIEIVKGAASAMFGSNAAGGVINIVTYSPLYDHSRVVTIGGSTQSGFTGDATSTFNGAWGGTKLSVGGLTENEFSTPRYVSTAYGYPCCDEHPPFQPFHTYLTNSSIINVVPDVQLNLEETYSKSAGNTGDPTDDYVVGGQDALTWSFRGGATWKSPIGLLTSDTYFNRSEVALYEPNDDGQPYQFNTNLLVSQLTDQFKLGTDDVFRLEFEYRYKTFRFGGEQLLPQSPVLAENNIALAGTWVHQFSDSLSSTIAARYDDLAMEEIGNINAADYFNKADYSHTDNAWSGNADLVWRIDDLDSIKGGYGRGVQMPSFMQSQYGQIEDFLGSLGVYPGNPRLKPTIVQDLDVEYSRTISPIASVLTLSPYVVMNQDIVTPFAGSIPEVVDGLALGISPSANSGNSKGWGGEIQLKGSKGPWRWDASYSYSRVNDGPTLGQAYGLSFDQSTPEHHLRFWGGYSTGKWEFDGNVQYLTGTDMLRSTDGGASSHFIPTGAYTSVGGRIAYTIMNGLVAAISGVNIQSHIQVTSPYPALERQILGTLTKRF